MFTRDSFRRLRHLRQLFPYTLWCFPFISFLAGYYCLSWRYGAASFPAPALLGCTMLDVVKTLSAVGLTPRIVGYKEEPDLAEGTIVGQTPAPSSPIKQQQTVFLVVSKKPDPLATPLCIAKTEKELTELEASSGVIIKKHGVSSSLPIHTCVAQYPAPGRPLMNNTVTVYVSASGQKPIIFPRCKGRLAVEAQSLLEHYDMEVEIIHEHEVSPQHVCHHCIVLEQVPKAGSIITAHGGQGSTKPCLVQLLVAPTRHTRSWFSFF